MLLMTPQTTVAIDFDDEFLAILSLLEQWKSSVDDKEAGFSQSGRAGHLCAVRPTDSRLEDSVLFWHGFISRDASMHIAQ